MCIRDRGKVRSWNGRRNAQEEIQWLEGSGIHRADEKVISSNIIIVSDTKPPSMRRMP